LIVQLEAMLPFLIQAGWSCIGASLLTRVLFSCLVHGIDMPCVDGDGRPDLQKGCQYLSFLSAFIPPRPASCRSRPFLYLPLCYLCFCSNFFSGVRVTSRPTFSERLGFLFSLSLGSWIHPAHERHIPRFFVGVCFT
jgi:hypothetical protein